MHCFCTVFLDFLGFFIDRFFEDLVGSRFGHLPRKPFSQGGGVGQVVTAMRAIVSRKRSGSMDSKFWPVDSIFDLGPNLGHHGLNWGPNF